MAGFGDVVVVGAFPDVKVVAVVASVKSSDLERHDRDGGSGGVVEAVVVG